MPPADVHYYRALALAERGSGADARLALRTFLAELPTSPYAAHARARLADAESHLDPRELEVSSGDVDSRLIARALGPAVGALDGCLAAGRLLRVKLLVAPGRLRCEPEHPLADCVNAALGRLDPALLAAARAGHHHGAARRPPPRTAVAGAAPAGAVDAFRD